MESNNQVSKGRLYTSYILQGIVLLMFFWGAANNILQTQQSVDGAVALGYAEEAVRPLGIVLLAATLLYAIPRTAILGAILLTGWLGGAIASHVINQDPLFNKLLPVIFGIIIWLSIWLRDKRLQNVLSSNSI